MESSEAVVAVFSVGIFLLWICVPMIPAVLIYWLFPDTKVGVGGPLSGLTVRATGAFAGYLVVLLVSLPLATRIHDTVGGFLKPVWTVRADVLAIGRDGQPIKEKRVVGELVVTLNPAIHSITAGVVDLRIPHRGQEWPHILFEIPDFGEQAIDLNRTARAVEVDAFNKVVEIKQPVVIRESTGATP